MRVFVGQIYFPGGFSRSSLCYKGKKQVFKALHLSLSLKAKYDETIFSGTNLRISIGKLRLELILLNSPTVSKEKSLKNASNDLNQIHHKLWFTIESLLALRFVIYAKEILI